MNSWLFNAVYFSQFGCCNPEILLFSQHKWRYQLCHFSVTVIQSLRRSLIGFIDLDESNSIGEEMCENHDFTFASDSSVACWISNTIEISMCNINSDIGTKCQLYFEFSFRPEVALKRHRKYTVILGKTYNNFMQARLLKWSSCANTTLYYSYLFYMFDKKETKD